MEKSSYNIGDKVQSAHNSTDVKVMDAVWKAKIIKIYKNGGFETLGKWEPLTKRGKNINAFWNTNPPSKDLSTRRINKGNLTKLI